MSNHRDEYGDPNVHKNPVLRGQEVTAVKKNGQGDIEGFQLSDGSVLSYEEAVTEVTNGNSKGLIAQKGNQDQTILRSAPDAYQSNNLDNLPTFE